MNEATDIEIYLANTSANSLKHWLQGELDSVVPADQQLELPKSAVAMKGSWKGESFNIVILERVSGRFTSLWLNSRNVPWDGDAECARAASAHFNEEARISAGGWTESEGPDDWIQILPDGSETGINWKTD